LPGVGFSGVIEDSGAAVEGEVVDGEAVDGVADGVVTDGVVADGVAVGGVVAEGVVSDGAGLGDTSSGGSGRRLNSVRTMMILMTPSATGRAMSMKRSFIPL
jgi:hypothetical protein